MLCLGEAISADYSAMETLLISPAMSQSETHTFNAQAASFVSTEYNDGDQTLIESTEVGSSEVVATTTSSSSTSSSHGAIVYSDYYDRIRNDAEWNERGQMCYIPLYGPLQRTSHGSFSSSLSSSGSSSPPLPSPIGDHLKKRDSASSITQFPIVAKPPQPFPEPFSEKNNEAGWYGNTGGNGPPSFHNELTSVNREFGASTVAYSSTESLTDVFGSQESLNNIGGGYGCQNGYGSQSGYGSRNYSGQQRSGGRFGGSNRRNYQSSNGYGNGNGGFVGNDQGYGNNCSRGSSYYDNQYDNTYNEITDVRKCQQSASYFGSGTTSTVPSTVPSGPLPTAFATGRMANINDEQKNNLMANLARLCNQRT